MGLKKVQKQGRDERLQEDYIPEICKKYATGVGQWYEQTGYIVHTAWAKVPDQIVYTGKWNTLDIIDLAKAHTTVAAGAIVE